MYGDSSSTTLLKSATLVEEGDLKPLQRKHNLFLVHSLIPTPSSGEFTTGLSFGRRCSEGRHCMDGRGVGGAVTVGTCLSIAAPAVFVLHGVQTIL